MIIVVSHLLALKLKVCKKSFSNWNKSGGQKRPPTCSTSFWNWMKPSRMNVAIIKRRWYANSLLMLRRLGGNKRNSNSSWRICRRWWQWIPPAIIDFVTSTMRWHLLINSTNVFTWNASPITRWDQLNLKFYSMLIEIVQLWMELLRAVPEQL